MAAAPLLWAWCPGPILRLPVRTRILVVGLSLAFSPFPHLSPDWQAGLPSTGTQKLLGSVKMQVLGSHYWPLNLDLAGNWCF